MIPVLLAWSMSNHAKESVAQSARWVIAGLAGAAVSTTMGEGLFYQIGYLSPMLIGLTAIDYLIRRVIEPNEGN